VPAGDLLRLAAAYAGKTDTGPPASTAAAFSIEDPFLFFIFLSLFHFIKSF
jgi:hypothetical protein